MLTKLMLNAEELAQLNYERYYYPCPIVQKRLNAVYIKASTNFTNEKVSLLAGVHYDNVGQWIAIYKENGFDGLCKINHHCNQSLLEKQAGNIKELFVKQPPRSMDKARLKIKELTGIERSNTRIIAFMKRYSVPFFKNRPYPCKIKQYSTKKLGKPNAETCYRSSS